MASLASQINVMRIIRVSGCDDCKYPEEWKPGKAWSYKCNHPDMWGKGFMIGSYMKSETLPDNCPLEKEVKRFSLYNTFWQNLPYTKMTKQSVK